MKTTTAVKFKETEVGLVPEEWITKKLDEISDIQTGPFGSQLHEKDYVEKGTPIITVEHILDDRIDHAGIIPQVSESDTARLSKRYGLRTGDIVFSRVGSVDRSAYVSEKENGWLFSGRLLRVRPDSTVVNSRWLDFWLRQEVIKEYVRNVAVGATMPSINTSLLGEIPVALPDTHEQNQIAEILSSIDDKIELNRAINVNLERLARAIFKKWFIDIDDKLPEGWKVGRLGQEFEIVMGQSPSGDTYNENGDGLPFYQGRTDFGFRFPSRRVYCTKPERKAKPMDTLISVRAPVGDVNMAYEECCIGRGVGAIRKDNFSSYTFYTIKSLEKDISQFNSEGTVFGSINKDSLSNISCIVPPQNVMATFEKIGGEIDKQILSLSKEMESLKNARDSLLPRLMSGKIRTKLQ